MRAERQQRRGEQYTGPVVVTVEKGEWQGFERLAPGWWPRKWATPSRSAVERVDQGLRKLLAA